MGEPGAHGVGVVKGHAPQAFFCAGEVVEPAVAGGEEAREIREHVGPAAGVVHLAGGAHFFCMPLRAGGGGQLLVELFHQHTGVVHPAILEGVHDVHRGNGFHDDDEDPVVRVRFGHVLVRHVHHGMRIQGVHKPAGKGMAELRILDELLVDGRLAYLWVVFKLAFDVRIDAGSAHLFGFFFRCRPLPLSRLFLLLLDNEFSARPGDDLHEVDSLEIVVDGPALGGDVGVRHGGECRLDGGQVVPPSDPVEGLGEEFEVFEHVHAARLRQRGLLGAPHVSTFPRGVGRDDGVELADQIGEGCLGTVWCGTFAGVEHEHRGRIVDDHQNGEEEMPDASVALEERQEDRSDRQRRVVHKGERVSEDPVFIRSEPSGRLRQFAREGRKENAIGGIGGVVTQEIGLHDDRVHLHAV